MLAVDYGTSTGTTTPRSGSFEIPTKIAFPIYRLQQQKLKQTQTNNHGLRDSGTFVEQILHCSYSTDLKWMTKSCLSLTFLKIIHGCT